MSEEKQYCLGFIFDPCGLNVLLMHKARPAWQRNKYNGIGSHVEPGETAAAAMARECDEEINIYTNADDWQHVCDLRGKGFSVGVFALYRDDLSEIESSSDGEPVYAMPVKDLPDSVIPNLLWLIPMCLSLTRGETARGFAVSEMTEAPEPKPATRTVIQTTIPTWSQDPYIDQP